MSDLIDRKALMEAARRVAKQMYGEHYDSIESSHVERARDIVGAYIAAAHVQWPSVKVGRFTIDQCPCGISITLNDKSDACGEGGYFSPDIVEEAIAAFYKEHF